MIANLNRNNIAELKKAIERAGEIVIISHYRPDGDAVGSSLALLHFLKTWNKKCVVVLPSEFPQFLSWLDGAKEILIYSRDSVVAEPVLKTADLIFCLDFNDAARVHNMKEFLLSTKAMKVLIDHHLDPSDFCDLNFSYPEASSTAEIIYNLLMELGQEKKLNKVTSEAIYTGIMTDTGSFRYASTKAETHEIVAALIRNGVQNFVVHEKVYNEFSEDRTRLMGFAVNERMKVLPEHNAAYIWLSEDDLKRFNHQPGDTEGLVNIALAIKGVKMAVLFTESEGTIKLSMRSVGDCSVQSLAVQHFEGGGHMNAAGGKSDMPMQQTIEKFEKILASLNKVGS